MSAQRPGSTRVHPANPDGRSILGLLAMQVSNLITASPMGAIGGRLQRAQVNHLFGS